jgi:serine/threonine-protein kinase
MNSTQKGGGKVRNNYYRAVVRQRRRVTHITPAGVFFRRIGNSLDRSMNTLLGIAAASVFITLLAGITAFATVVLPDRSGLVRVTIPDFCGSVYSAGTVDPELFDINIEYKFDNSSPAGMIISQYPPAGAARMVKKGERRCALTLMLSRGPETIILPDFTGDNCAEAELELRSLGFSVSIVQQYSATALAGTVISTSPPAYSDLPTGATVTLYVSLGQELEYVVVPALTGLGETAAITKLLSVGLLVGKTEYVKSPKPAGTVIAQSEPFGSRVRAGTKIYLTVSLGGG